MNRNLWTHEQTIVVLDLYCKVPFNKATNSNIDIQTVAKMIGRSVNSVKMKIGNFGNFDPELKKSGITGLSGTSKLDEEIWNEYFEHWDKLAYDAKILTAKFSNQNIDELLKGENFKIPEGKEKEVIVRQRINQTFFRNAVLSSYDSKCCVTGLSEPRLLEACHIVDWTEDEANRTNPSNGLCMNPLIHKAYDKFLLSVDADFKIKISERLLENSKADMSLFNYFKGLSGKSITLPTRFFPKREFLEIHHKIFLEGM